MERQYIHLANGDQKTDAYRDINPQGLVPFLVDDDLKLGQSLAIIEYLDELHPTPPLLPSDAATRARVRAFAQAIACDIHPLNNLRVLNYVTGTLGHTEAEKNTWYQHWIHEGFLALEATLARRDKQAPYCFGDVPGLADICLIPQVANALRFKCPMESFPTISAIYVHAMQHPAFAAADPTQQPDYPNS